MTDEPVDLVDAQGGGADLFSAPTAFYLTHRETIERWSALKRTADIAIHDYLTGFGDLVAERAEDLGFTAGVLDFGSRYSGAMMWAPQTPERGGVPRIALGIGWKREDTYPSDENRAPYVGVRTGPRSTADREEFLSSGAPATRTVRDGQNYASDRHWPVYRYVPHDRYWWADLDVFVERLIAELDVVIDLFADRVAATATALASAAD